MEVLSSNNFDLKPVQYRTMSEFTAASIRNSIICGNLAPGTKITESELAERFDVSRNVIREAVLMLVAEGLLIKKRNRYTKVISFTPEDITCIFNLRMAVETAALKSCIKQPNFCAELEKCSEKIEEIIQKPDINFADLMYADISFHSFIIESSKNRWLSDTWMRIVGPMQMLLYKHMNELQAMKSSHLNLIEIMRTGDYQKVSAAIENHIDDTLQELLKL